LIRKMPFEGIGHPFAVRTKFIAPHIRFTRESTARGKLPLGLRGKSLARPFCIRHRILPGNLHHRIIALTCDTAAWPERMAPVCAAHVRPPLKMVVERNWMIRRSEHDRAGDKILRRCSGIVFCPRLSLSDRYIS